VKVAQSISKLFPLPFVDFSIAYYELHVDEPGEVCEIGIGVALKNYLKAMPGWDLEYLFISYLFL